MKEQFNNAIFNNAVFNIEGSTLAIIADFAAIFIALIALGFTGWQLIVQRKHNRISIKPSIDMKCNHTTNGDSHIEYVLINGGLGPAFINKFTMLINNESCNFDEEIKPELDKFSSHVSRARLAKGLAVSRGESVVLVSAKFPTKNKEEVERIIGTLQVVVEYSSGYGDKFELDSREYG